MGYDKIVKGATKIKMAAPKAKYIEPILAGTEMPQELDEIFKGLSGRLRDTAWTIVYKSLIVVHIMIREGRKDAALEYLSHHARMLDCRHLNAANSGRYGDMIVRYSRYLQERVRQYASLKIDYVRHKKDNPNQGRLRNLTVEKGLLREVEGVQSQIHYLLLCKFYPNDVNDDIALTAFRLLVHDLLALHQAMNEGVINVLEHYFEMSRYDAERALQIYKTFVDKMDGVVDYLQVARQLEGATKLLVPNIKHAPTSLTSALEEYLNDPDFDVNRRQFLAQKEAKLHGKVWPQKSVGIQPTVNGPTTFDSGAGPQNHASNPSEAKSPEQTLVDFFASIEQQEPMFQDSNGDYRQHASNGQEMQAKMQMQMLQQQHSQQLQQSPPAGVVLSQGIIPHVPIPQPLSQDYTGAGFGGYSSQSQAPLVAPPAYGVATGATGTGVQYGNPAPFVTVQPTGSFGNSLFSLQQLQQPTSIFPNNSGPTSASSSGSLMPQTTGSSNPFRKSATFSAISPQATGGHTNPFSYNNSVGNHLPAVPETGMSMSSSMASSPSLDNDIPQIGLSRSNTNPFVKNTSSNTSPSPLAPESTGSNPFRR
ncbi:ANTH domain-containing protein [Dipodascopsis uninucleata]